MNDTRCQGRAGDGLYKKRGIWYFRVTDWTGKRRAVSSGTSSHAEAKTVRAKMEKDLDAGVNPFGAGKMPFAQAAAIWLERRSLDTAPETIRARQIRIRNINAVLGELPLGKFNGDVLAKYQMLRSEKLKPASVNAETKTIVSVLKQNHLWARIAGDYKPLREPASAGRKLTAEELENLLRVAEERHELSVIFLVMRFLLETGLRHKELRLLRLENVDLSVPEIHIARETTKTDDGMRVIPLTPVAAAIAAELLQRAQAFGAKDPKHYLFPGIRFISGHRVPDPTIAQESFRDAWQTLRRLAGVDPSIRIHDLRHHVATDLAEAGVAAAVAMRLMGWKSPAMLKRYEHIQGDALRRGMEMLQISREMRATPPPKMPPGRVIPFPARRTGNSSA